MLLDGECVASVQCPLCTDEKGYGRRNGEQWNYIGDPCTIATCMSDSSIVQSQTDCAPAPKCAANEVKI